MLEAAIKEKRGLPPERDEGCEMDMNIDAFLPPSYIVNELQKLDMYKRIAAIRNEADAGDMRDEMKDRFGGIPIEAERLIQIAELKAVASSEYITKVSGRDGNLNLTMDRNAPVDVDRIPYLLNDYGGDLRLKTVGDPVFTLLYEGSGPELMLEKTKELLEHMKMIIMVK